MNQDICFAIESRQVVTFLYHGGPRTAEPFCYGVSTAGNEVLRAYQTGGFSRGGESVGWKLFRIDEIFNLEITNESFAGKRLNYNSNDKAMTTIYCSV